MKKILANTIPKNGMGGYCQNIENSADNLGSSPELSVIIPAYNMERYLERCIESVENAGCIHMEVIVVNDGSSDQTMQIAKQMSKKYGNIKIINQQNTGLYHTKVNGIHLARGNYITFVDADDKIAVNFYTFAVRKIKEKKVDILEFGIRKVKGEQVLFEFCPQERIYGSKEAIRRQLEKDASICSNCNKVYKRTLFHNVSFPEAIRCHEEDKLINIKAMCNAKKVASTPAVGYIYDTRENSITTKAISKDYLDILKAGKAVYNLIKRKRSALSRIAAHDYCAHLSFCYLNLFRMGMEKVQETVIKRQIRKEFFNVYRIEKLDIYRAKQDSMKRRAMLLLFWKSPWLAELLYRVIFISLLRCHE